MISFTSQLDGVAPGLLANALTTNSTITRTSNFGTFSFVSQVFNIKNIHRANIHQLLQRQKRLSPKIAPPKKNDFF